MFNKSKNSSHVSALYKLHNRFILSIVILGLANSIQANSDVCKEINASLKNGITLSEISNAIFARNDELVASMVSCKPEIIKQNSPAGSMLVIAAQINPQNDGKIENIINTLIKAGSDLDDTDRSKNTALIQASKKGYIESVRLLVEAGANINLQNKDYETAIIVATKEEHFETAGYLLKNGADLSIDAYGSRAYTHLANNYEQYTSQQKQQAVSLITQMLDKYAVFNIGQIDERWELERLDKIENMEIRKRLATSKIVDAGPTVNSRHIEPHYPEVHKALSDNQPTSTFIKITEDGPVVIDPSKQPKVEIKEIDYIYYKDYLAEKDNKKEQKKENVKKALKERESRVINGCLVEREANCPNTDFSKADLRYVDLSGADLQGSKFNKAQLKEANFQGADLSGADFSSTYLFKNNLSQANLKGADFTNANLQSSNLTGANLESALFKMVKIMGSDFTRAKWKDPDFTGATLMSPVFGETTQLDKAISKAAHVIDPVFTHNGCVIKSGTNCNEKDLSGYIFHAGKLENVSFIGANLSGADLSEVKLINVNLRDADLSNAILPNTISNANLSNANLSGSKFKNEKDNKSYENVILKNADLTSTSLVKLKLHGGSLEQADLSNADLSYADLRLSNLSNTIFNNVISKGCNGCPVSDEEKRQRREMADRALKQFVDIDSLSVINIKYQNAIELFHKKSSLSKGASQQAMKHIELDRKWRVTAYKQYAELALLSEYSLIITRKYSPDNPSLDFKQSFGMIAVFPLDCDKNQYCKSTFQEYSDTCAVVLRVGDYVIDNQYPSWDEMIYCEGGLSRSYLPEYLKIGYRVNGSEYPYYEYQN